MRLGTRLSIRPVSLLLNTIGSPGKGQRADVGLLLRDSAPPRKPLLAEARDRDCSLPARASTIPPPPPPSPLVFPPPALPPWPPLCGPWSYRRERGRQQQQQQQQQLLREQREVEEEREQEPQEGGGCYFQPVWMPRMS
ncbi:hypothetical protein J1605_003304 [Eschrichtius robustus]|uniref:Uncharacterized protein n=1 Tax=Eschrichtius robustus TaxID=9764 RepID=A0AB34HSS9_ESCRO|nr:hypothetical protein J1605_003304 [Eschrichtius robustus]